MKNCRLMIHKQMKILLKKNSVVQKKILMKKALLENITFKFVLSN